VNLKINESIKKKRHKNLYILEACYIYCKRYGLNYETFMDEIFFSEDFNTNEGSEFDKINKDLMCYGRTRDFLIEITSDEYKMCIDKFDKI